MPALAKATTAITNSTIELILTAVPALVLPLSQDDYVVPSKWFHRPGFIGAGLRSRVSHAAGEDLSQLFQPGRLSFWFWLAPPALDSGFRADGFEVLPMRPAGQVWRATAVRTFFEGPEGHS
jgi:hypothetical protein